MKTVLITGAGARIGRHFAKGLAADGWSVVVHYSRSHKGAEALADEIKADGGQAAIVKANLVIPDDVSTLISHAAEAAGTPLTALINNASTFKDDRADDFTSNLLDHHMDVNLRAPLTLARDFARQCPKQADGCILNMIDNRVLKPNPLFFTYSLSKASLYWATRTLAQSLAPDIRVNGIGPGPTLQNTGQSEADFAREAAHTLLEKSSSLDDLLNACRYLLSAPSVTGQMLCVDSGQHLTWKTEDVLAGGIKDEA